ncbi:MAG: hypothetical protein HXY30_02160 [Pseudorhodoplanes sp.]|nr:hypothetical protein [Pseudorhodoplanes sp.]
MPMRPPSTVMKLARLGSFHQTRLSFMRVLLRRLARERWTLDRPIWELDERGVGVGVYRARGPARTYSLVAFSHDLPPEKRTDRVIAEEWDATFALVDGEPSPADIARLRNNVPRQEAGRVAASELVLARANRSVRLFDHVVQSLAAGRQPDSADLAAIGYLMRTTAVYGSGKFGLADRESICGRPEFAGPFQAEMLAVFLIRAFTFDLVDHLARAASPKAVPLDPALRRSLGVGNATGLGMAPFLVNHPALIDRWIAARETALARVRNLEGAERWAEFVALLPRARALVAGWKVDDAVQARRIAELTRDLDRLAAHVADVSPSDFRPWDELYQWAEANLGLEGQELLVSLLIEPHGALVDDLAEQMACDEDAEFTIDGAMTLAQLQHAIETRYAFALATDFSLTAAQARFWYVSEEKLEPRLGERAQEDGAEREQPLTVARDVAALGRALQGRAGAERLGDFLRDNPDFRNVVRRVQIAIRHPYAEVQDNLLDAAMRPIDLLRCKLACFGATRFDPKSDRWVRITMFQGAPLPEDIGRGRVDDWIYPPALPGSAA